ncbi:alpha/beta fold hydrolase [Arthrobacter ramosus]|uniref:Alpha/beta fold hydrolase n=1 Tax=Arthrobacter ramosus TaxID=1672 RepID=A0ABV5Y4G7_ARTRM|nr:alpha/beta hydrolase [Arthrobacter ramosus]
MSYDESSFTSTRDALKVATYRWRSDAPRVVVQIAHGLAEYATRYDRLANALTAAGFEVYANDHRGHGSSVGGDVSLGSFGEAGWSALVADVVTLGESIAAQHPSLLVFLLGHSMGSFASQELLLDRSDLYAGVVLTGSTSLDALAAGLAEAGDLGNDLTFLNSGFEGDTGYEWLSRDEAEVAAYVADPRCGFDLAPDTIPQLFGTAPRLADPEQLAGIRSDLPVLIVSGDTDPLSGGGQLVELLGARYRDAGMTDVTVRLFPEARHEVFNETNRDEITADVVTWLKRHV